MATLLSAASLAPAAPVTLYLDANGATAGSGVVDGTHYAMGQAFWSADAAGTSSTGVWNTLAGGDEPSMVLSAGTDAAGLSYFVDLGNDFGIASMTVEEGAFTVQRNGAAGQYTLRDNATWSAAAGATLSFGGHVDLNGFTLTLGSAANPGDIELGAFVHSGGYSAGVIEGTGSLVKEGDGTATLAPTASHTYTGSTTIHGGTLELDGGDDRLPVGTNVHLADAAGASLDLGGTNQTVRWLTGGGADGGSIVNTGGTTSTLTLNLLGSGTRAFGGTIEGDIQVAIKDSNSKNSDVQVFAGANTYTGGTVIDNGHLRVANDAYLGAVPGSVAADNIVLKNGGVLQNNNSALVLNANRGVLLESGDGVIYAGWVKDVTLGGPLSGPGRLVKSDSGKLFLGSAGTHTGDTVFAWAPGTSNAGTIVLNHGDALAQSTFDATGIGEVNGTLDLGGLDVVLGGLKGNGAGITNFTGQLSVGNNGQDTTFSGSLSGSGSLRKIGAGTLTLTADQAYTGATAVAEGTLLVQHSLEGGVAVEAAGTLSAGNSPGSLAVAGPYAQAGTLWVEIAGNAPGAQDGYDQVNVDDAAVFEPGAIVDVDLLGFQPALGDVFDVLTATGGINADALDHIAFDFDDAVLTTPALRWEASIHQGAGFDALRLTVGVPEPSTWALAALALAALVGSACRRRRT